MSQKLGNFLHAAIHVPLAAITEVGACHDDRVESILATNHWELSVLPKPTYDTVRPVSVARSRFAVLPALGAQAEVDAAARGALWDLVLSRRAALLAVLVRGIERQQIRSDLDLGLAHYLIFGPVYYRYLGALAGHTPNRP